MTDLFEQPDNATPLTPEEQKELIPSYITFRGELNLAEQENIAKARAWAIGTKCDKLLTDTFIKELHRRMFSDVWRWAGQYSKTEKNIGVDPTEIPVEVRKLVDDVRTQIECNSFSPDEIAVRLHHRLTKVHAFPNGNGRHARLMADLLIEDLAGKPFSWGSGSLHEVGPLRDAYIGAIRAADKEDYGPLMKFVRA
jgi:Fic-DOC domain mobile mystery protein B